MKSIYIADDFHPSLMQGLEKLNLKVQYKPTASREEILEGLVNADTLLLRSKTSIDLDFLSRAPLLKYIGRGGAGMDNINVELCNEHGIHCFNAGEANSVAVAEHSLGFLLSLIRNINSADREVRNRIWLREENRGKELASLKIGIIGFGNTGSAFGRILASLGSTVLAYDKYKKGFGQGRIRECQLKELLREADVISLHVPLTHETKKMVDQEFILKCIKPIILLNMCRGAVVCLKSVIEGLDNCKIAGFGTDVLENEKFQTFTQEQESTFETVASKKRVIFTPHIAGWTEESYQKISEVLLKKIENLV